MLRIGKNQYELVRAHSGFSATVQPKAEDVIGREQKWEMEACYIPASANYTPRDDGVLEYLKLVFQPEKYSVKNWRELSGFGLDTADDLDYWDGWAWAENLTAGRFKEEKWTVIPGWLEVEHLDDYFFRCRFDGEFERGDKTREKMEFEDIIPFGSVVARVPINAANPVAAARLLASRIVGLKEFSSSRVQCYDPKRKSYAESGINTHHLVTLETPWRRQLA